MEIFIKDLATDSMKPVGWLGKSGELEARVKPVIDVSGNAPSIQDSHRHTPGRPPMQIALELKLNIAERLACFSFANLS
jgi:hypothetical protein